MQTRRQKQRELRLHDITSAKNEFMQLWLLDNNGLFEMAVTGRFGI